MKGRSFCVPQQSPRLRRRFLDYPTVPESPCDSGYEFMKKSHVIYSCTVIIHRQEPGYILVKSVNNWLAPLQAIDCPLALSRFASALYLVTADRECAHPLSSALYGEIVLFQLMEANGCLLP